MTIASEIARIEGNISAAYTAADAKGATIPSTENSDNLATCIASITTGSSPVISSLNVTPTTSAQTITAPSGTDGYSPINVSAVTSSIDANIVAGNIISGVSILGVNGSATVLNGDTLNVTPTTSAQTLTPTSPKNGFTQVSVAAVTSSIDANITAGNIKDGVSILGVTGNYTGSGGGSTKFGLGIDNFIGNMNGNGVLGSPSSINGITFTGLVELGFKALQNLFYDKYLVSGTVSFPDLTTVRTNGLYQAFSGNLITSVDLSALTTVEANGLGYAFADNQITSVSLPALTTVGEYGLDYAFANNQITSVSLPTLTTVGEYGLDYAFFGNLITSVSLPTLTTVGESGLCNAFDSNRITSVSLPALTTVGEYGLCNAFANNIAPDTGQTTLQTVSFPALTSDSFESDDESAFDGMLLGNEDVTVHFPSNLEEVIGEWDSVLNGFDGTNTTILFDLPATE